MNLSGYEAVWVMGLAALTFVSAWSTLNWWMRQHTWAQRLRRRLHVSSLPAVTPRPSAARSWRNWLHQLREPLAKLAHPQEAQEASRLRIALWQAGWSSPSAMVTFLAWRVGLALTLPLVGLAVMHTLPVPGVVLRQTYAVLTALAVLGYGLPRVVLAYRIRQRQQRIAAFLPDAVDLLVVCMEAGLGLDMALQRTAGQMQLQCPELARELDFVTTQLRVGSSRAQALRQLTLRTGLSDVGWLVAAMLQSDRYGTPLAQGLRIHAKDFRLRRQRRAEEAAARLPVQLLFPLLLTLFPALFVVLVGPAAIGLMRSLGPLLSST